MFASRAHGQQFPHYTHFIYNYQFINPASTGYVTCSEFKSNYRQQWAGLDGAPRTTAAMYHARIAAKKFAFHGVGINMESDMAGAFGYSGLTAQYAFHTRVTKGYNLAAGIGLGFLQYRVDFNKISFKDPLNETAITGNVNGYVIPNINLGLWLYRGDRFYGLSVRSITNPVVGGSSSNKMIRSYTLTYGKYIKINKKYSFKPSFMVNYTGKSKADINAQAIIDYKGTIGFGAAVRSGHGVSALIRVQAWGKFTFCYAYDVTANRLRYGSYSTHEVSVGLRTCAGIGRDKDLCAAYE
jgi:type IX secretion system PorP/SprF family membrane protein